MLVTIRDCLDKNIPSCRGILLSAFEGRAFCSGADIKHVASLTHSEQVEFLSLEYSVHQRLLEAHTKHNIPVLALADGIVMGAGAGLWMAAQTRVATPRTLFAMPECNIGLLPDAGALHFLRTGCCSPSVGLWLAVTGTRLSGSEDLLGAGLATHFVDGALQADNGQGRQGGGDQVGSVDGDQATPPAALTSLVEVLAATAPALWAAKLASPEVGALTAQTKRTASAIATRDSSSSSSSSGGSWAGRDVVRSRAASNMVRREGRRKVAATALRHLQLHTGNPPHLVVGVVSNPNAASGIHTLLVRATRRHDGSAERLHSLVRLCEESRAARIVVAVVVVVVVGIASMVRVVAVITRRPKHPKGRMRTLVPAASIATATATATAPRCNLHSNFVGRSSRAPLRLTFLLLRVERGEGPARAGGGRAARRGQGSAKHCPAPAQDFAAASGQGRSSSRHLLLPPIRLLLLLLVSQQRVWLALKPRHRRASRRCSLLWAAFGVHIGRRRAKRR